MNRLILPNFWEKHSILKSSFSGDGFENNDENIRFAADRVKKERAALGLEGMVGGLSSIIINTERENQTNAVKEILKYTGFELFEAFEDRNYITYVLKLDGSADILVRSRKEEQNPFKDYNVNPKSKHLPNTRIESFVFETKNIEEYVSIQKARGVRFLTEEIVYRENYSFIQTIPSSFTGNSTGFIEWKCDRGSYSKGSKIINTDIEKPGDLYLKNIMEIDHAATRVNAKFRDAAIIEFMELTNYNFEFAIYVEALNSITNVARLKGEKFAIVFTSGISPYVNDEISGPTEKYIKNYGTRVHHIAFRTENIEESFEELKKNGMEFLIDLVGSSEEGLKQTFTRASKNTLVVNEYILRYGDFDGFFTKSNVTKLTKATEAQ